MLKVRVLSEKWLLENDLAYGGKRRRPIATLMHQISYAEEPAREVVTYHNLAVRDNLTGTNIVAKLPLTQLYFINKLKELVAKLSLAGLRNDRQYAFCFVPIIKPDRLVEVKARFHFATSSGPPAKRGKSICDGFLLSSKGGPRLLK